MKLSDLQARIEEIYAAANDRMPDDAEAVFDELRDALTAGVVRAAVREGDDWRVNPWVKKGILVGFRIGRAGRIEGAGAFSFIDKHTLPVRRFDLDDAVRVVPGGSSIREGAYIGRDVICMPPMYVNIGAYVDDGSLIDSHALVGSCAQIGKRVHVSAGAQIGGVLEPVGALPVIVGDDALIGGNCGVYEGTVVGEGAVLAAGTVITAATPVYDTVHERVLKATVEAPLAIPPRAVVVPGSRPARGPFARTQGLQVATPLIVKYRDRDTDAATALEEALRS